MHFLIMLFVAAVVVIWTAGALFALGQWMLDHPLVWAAGPALAWLVVRPRPDWSQRLAHTLGGVVFGPVVGGIVAVLVGLVSDPLFRTLTQGRLGDAWLVGWMVFVARQFRLEADFPEEQQRRRLRREATLSAMDPWEREKAMTPAERERERFLEAESARRNQR